MIAMLTRICLQNLDSKGLKCMSIIDAMIENLCWDTSFIFHSMQNLMAKLIFTHAQ